MDKKLLWLSLFCTLLLAPTLSRAQCNFTPSANLVCGGELVNFNVIAPAGGSIYSWDFNNDGNVDNFGTSVSFPFPVDIINRTFTVSLFRDGIFCSSQNIQVRFTPDASIAVVPGSGIMDGNEMRVCNADTTAELTIYNASLTYSNNVSYSIDWGDGNTDTYTNATFPNSSFISHMYNGDGYYNVRVEVTGTNGCVGVETYVFYNGSNPSVGLASPGNTVGLCVPATIRFPIINTELNPDGTVYVIRIGGDTVGVYTQANIPDTLVYTFLEASCGTATSTGNYQNAFDVQVLATNPCGSSNAIIEPIEISEPPEINFDVDRPLTGCAQEPFTFTNSSTGIQEVVSGNCSTNLTGGWTITPGVPGVHWNILAGNPFGSDILIVEWLIPGDYTVKMSISSPSCGEFEIERGITIIDEATAGADVTLVNASSPVLADICAPTLGLFSNSSVGDSLSYNWTISPSTGWLYANGTNDTTTNLDVIFTQAGSYNVSMTASNQCSADTWDTLLVIAGDPAIILDPIDDECESATLNFNASNVLFHANGGSFQSFNWSFPGATPSSSTDQYPTGIHYDTPGNYIVTVSVANECGSYTTSTNFYIQQPASLTIDPDMELCRDVPPFQLNANLTGGLWTGNGVSSSGMFNPATANVGANTITYTYLDTLCVLVDTMVITVNPLPVISPGPDQEACVSDANFLITGFSPAGGTWTSDNGGVIVGSNAFDPGASGDGVYTLTYSFTDANGCSAQASKTVIIHPLPAVDAGPDKTVCDNPLDVQMTGQTPTGGVWSGVGVTPTGTFNVTNTPGVGTYQLFYTYTNQVTGCTNTDSLEVNVIPPTSADAGPDEEVCVNDDPYTITSGLPVSGYWTGPGVDSTSNTFDPAAAGVGVHVLTYTFGDSNCEDKDTKLITVRDIPSITIMSDREECIDFGNIPLVASPSGGTWSGIGITGSDFVPQDAGAGTFVLTYTYTDATTNCTNTADVTIIINPLPVVNTQDTTYCNTPGLVALPAATPSGGNWSGPGVVGLQFDPGQAGGVGSYSLTYTFTDSEGCSNSETVSVQVISPESIDAGPDRLVCIDNGVIDLSTASSPAGGTWSANGSNGLSGSTFNPTVAGVGTHTLTYTVGSGNCQVFDDMVVEIKALPIVEAGGSIEVCENASPVTLAGYSPTGGVWSGSGLSDIVNGIFDPSSVPPGDYTLTYTYTDVYGCVDSDTKAVTVFPLPNIIVSDTAYCNTPGFVDLPVTSPAGGQWSGSGVFGNQFDPQSAGGVGTYILTYTFTDGNNCSNSETINVNVIAPDNVDAGTDRIVCIDNGALDLSLNASPSGGTWSANGSIGLSGSTFDPAVAGAGVYTLTYSVGSGNCEVTDDVVIEVKPLPIVEAGQDGEICINEDPVQLTGYSPAGGQWSGSGIVDVVNGIFDPSSVVAGDYTLTYTYTDAFGCVNSDTKSIRVFPLPVIAVNDTAYCNTPGLVDLPVTDPVGGQWSGSGVFGNQFDPQAAGGVGTYILTYEFTDGNNCSNSETINVNVIAPDNVDAGPDRIVCIDNAALDLSLSASPSGGTWSANGSIGLSGDTFDPAVAGAGVYTLTYSVGSGNCEVTDDVVIEVKPLPIVEAGQDDELCINEDPIQLAGYSPLGGQWSGSGIVDVINGIFDPASVAAGDHVIEYTYTDAFGCTNVDTRTITVHPLPIISPMSDTAFCNTPGLVLLPRPTPSGGQWSGPGVLGGQFNPQAAGGVGVYTLVYSFTDGNGCNNTEDMQVTVIAPQDVEAGPNRLVCIDHGIIDLSVAATPLGGTWSANGSSGLSGAQFNPSEAGAGIHVLTYSIGADNCRVTDNVVIEVKPLPVVEAGARVEICINEDPISLTGFSPAGGVWSGDGLIDVVNGVFDPTSVAAGEHVLTYTFTDFFGCVNSDSMTVEVKPLPLVEAGPDTTFCNAPLNVQLTPATPIGGNWTGPGVVNPTNGTFNPDVAGGEGIYELTYTYTDPTTGCTDFDQLFVTVVSPEDIEAGPNDTLCVDQGLYQLPGFTTSIDGTWTGPGIVDDKQGTFDPALAGAGIHIIKYSYGVGSCYVEDTKTVLVVDLSYVLAGPDENSCLTYPAFELSGESPTGGIWSGAGILNGSTGFFDPGLAGVGTHTINYTYTDELSGCQYTTTKEVTVFPMVEPDFILPEVACRNVPISFENLTPSTYRFWWSFGDGRTSSAFEPVHTYYNDGDYTVRLIVENDYGCRDTVEHSIIITDRPVAFFEPETKLACEGIEMELTNESYGYGLSYLWDFGNGRTSTEANPGVVFFGQGINDTTYVITLEVTNLCGTSVYQDVITVRPTPKPSIGISTESDCSPITINFANTTVGAAATYFWDFGNGETSTEAIPPSQIYTTDSTTTIYDIMLIATNECGVDTAFTQVVVEPADVRAFFEASDLIGCQPLTVDFTNYSTPGAKIDWDFGDGNTSAQDNPTHTFEEAGTFKVVQYANSECGYDTTALLIKVLPQPDLFFTHETRVCIGQEVQFMNQSQNVSGNIWDFGDGDTSFLNNPVHTYYVPGTYTVSLSGVSQFNQCPAVYTSEVTVLELPHAEFEPSEAIGCVPMTVNFADLSRGADFYIWDFGDGNSGAGAAPTHVFDEVGSYNVSLVVGDANGCYNDTTLLNILVNPTPTSEFEFDQVQQCQLPAIINFSNQSEGAIGYSWTFGDGESTTFNEPTHTYVQAGNYPVELVAVNQFNCADTSMQELTIYPEPVASFQIDGVEGCAPMDVTFANRSTGSNSYRWEFGDGSISTEANPQHRYTEEGAYDIKLVVSIDSVCYDSIELQSQVLIHPQPIASFEAIEGTGIDQNTGTYQFLNQSQNADTYYWEFDDGRTTDEESPIHRFLHNGNRQIYLEASSIYGCVDDTLITIEPPCIKGLHLPNGFSPEHGIGDVRLFKPTGIGLKEFHVQVFSPYGQLLWESRELDENGSPSEAWDGTHNGQLLPQDVYVWRAVGIFCDGTAWQGAEGEDGTVKTMGSVIILR
ncbi:MAG: PKD domain-containing protein [Bacteroidota bacterium]